jgi:hypothetical protein
MGRWAGAMMLAVTLGACRAESAGQAPALLTVRPLFGPVIGPEVIGGRAGDNAVTLLAGGTDLVRVDLQASRASRVHLALAPGDSCWSLARLSDGSLWTLKGRHTLARIEDDGRVREALPLAAAHFGVFAAGDRLVFQEATFTAPGPALVSGAIDGRGRTRWSDITTRPFDRIARASAAALNMVSCGATQTAERPCWFPDEAAVFLVKQDGATRRVELAGLDVVPPEALLTSDNPRRPVRDAYIDATGSLWILSSGDPAPGQADLPGGWILARYGTTGGPHGQARLERPARLILRADAARVMLLLSTGEVGEVNAW